MRSFRCKPFAYASESVTPAKTQSLVGFVFVQRLNSRVRYPFYALPNFLLNRLTCSLEAMAEVKWSARSFSTINTQVTVLGGR